MPDSEPVSGTLPTVATTRTIQEQTIPVGGWAGLVVNLFRALNGLTTERALIYFLCAFIGFYVWTDRQDRKDNSAADRRSREDIEEKNRISQDARDKEGRASADARVDKILSHCAQDSQAFREELRQELNQMRTVVSENTKVMEDLKKFLKREPEEPVLAPHPRMKTKTIQELLSGGH